MKTLMAMLIVVISLITIIQVDGFSYDEENILGEKMERPKKFEHKCSNKVLYPDGCCKDEETKPNLKKHKAKDIDYNKDEACAFELCFDYGQKYCRVNKDNCNTNKRVKRKCPATCNLCEKHSSPKAECQKKHKNNPELCCWDGTFSTSCPPCKDRKPKEKCKMFMTPEGSCDTGAYGTTVFLEKECAESCKLC